MYGFILGQGDVFECAVTPHGVEQTDPGEHGELDVVAGIGRGLPRQRHDRVVQITDAGREPGHTPLKDARRAGSRDVQIPQDLAQPSASALGA